MQQAWIRFSREEWATSFGGDLDAVLPLHSVFPADEAREVVIPTASWLRGTSKEKRPFVIGVTGSVTVGKSTFCGVLSEAIRQWPGAPSVAVVTTDSYLWPNEILEARGIMHRKGFPESYDLESLRTMLQEVRDRSSSVSAPVYSHELYDIVPSERRTIPLVDVLVLEGVLTGSLHEALDALVYLNAEEEDLAAWFLQRTFRLRQAAIDRPDQFFHRFRDMSDQELTDRAMQIWRDVNLVNLREHILPYRDFADLILCKGRDHRTTDVLARAPRSA